MAQLFAGVYSNASASGALFLDLTNAQGVRFGTNEHGFSDFEAFYPCGLAESFRIYDRPGLPHVSVVGNGATAWEGRLEDVAIVNGGVRLKAFGYQRALSDAPYTGLFSDTSTNKWITWTTEYDSSRRPELYAYDFDNRIWAGLTKGASYGASTDTYIAAYYTPNTSTQYIAYFSGSYAYNLPSGWTFRIGSRNAASSVVAFTDITTSGGSTAGGSFAYTYAASLAVTTITFGIYNSASVSYTAPSASESGAYYAKLTSPRITSGASVIYPSDIAASLAAVYTNLPSTSSVLITSNPLDLQNEVYNDETGADILTRLAGLGSSAGSVWEWGVYDGGLLHYRARGSAGRAWYVDATALEVERTIDTLYNSVYAKYSDANGRTLRTAASTASDSVSRYGLTRTRKVNADTTSATQAGYIRDVGLTDGKDPSPRVGLVFDRLYDATGAQWPLWACMSGDSITIRNLPPSISSAIDRISTFRVSETDYDAMTDTITVTPETPVPALDVMIAQE